MDELPKFNDIRELAVFRQEWNELLEQKKEAQSGIVNNDIYSTLEYLSFCDRLAKWMLLNARDLEKFYLTLIKPGNKPRDNMLALETNDLKVNIQQRMQSLQDEYRGLSEMTLRRCEDIVTRFTNGNKPRANIVAEINQNLDKELILQELKDSLEDYRLAREEYVTVLETPFDKVPDQNILADSGEEFFGIDPILSQLESIITSCDYAMIINDVEE